VSLSSTSLIRGEDESAGTSVAGKVLADLAILFLEIVVAHHLHVESFGVEG
jgi:hypothetical protein